MISYPGNMQVPDYGERRQDQAIWDEKRKRTEARNSGYQIFSASYPQRDTEFEAATIVSVGYIDF